MQSVLLSQLMLSRRSALGLAAGAVTAGVTGGGGAETGARATSGLNYDDPADNLYAFGKIWASYDEPVIGAFHGLMYARIGDRRMVPVFGYTGTGVLFAKIDENGDFEVIGRYDNSEIRGCNLLIA